MTEVSWVRSVYLYVMCAVSVALVGVGAVTAVVGIVHTIAPDLGHRDTLDRVGIGLSNIGADVVDLFNESELDSIEQYCEDVTDDADEVEDCIADELEFSGGDELDSIEDGIASVKDELRSQIRNNSIDQLIKGLLMVGAGVVLFKIHGRRTELFADGLGLRAPAGRSPDAAAVPPEPVEPVSLEPLPPPPPPQPQE